MPSTSNVRHPVHMIIASSPPSLSLDSPLYHRDTSYSNIDQNVGRSTRQRPNIGTPDFNVHESEIAYFLEGEFPGVEDKTEIVLKQVSAGTLMVEAKVPKSDLYFDWEVLMVPPCQSSELASECEKLDTDLTHWAVDTEAVQCEPAHDLVYNGTKKDLETGMARDIVLERRVGHLKRTFTFLTPVDFDSLRSKFTHGLLRIMVLKSREMPVEHRTFFIEE